MRSQAWAVLALLALLGISQLACAEDRLLSSNSMSSFLDGAEAAADMGLDEEGPNSVPSILRRELLQATGTTADPTAGAYGDSTAAFPETATAATPLPPASPVSVTLAPPGSVQTAGAAGVTVGAVTLLMAAAAALFV